MRVETVRDSSEDQRLAAALEALANPVRLALLRELRTPKALREIEVKIPVAEAGEEHGRNLARQTVRAHLDRLLEIGAVLARDAERDYGPTVEYMLNHQALFALTEEFRGLAQLRPSEEPRAPTVQRKAAPAPSRLAGPALILVKGLDEGRSFDLTPPAQGRKQWIIGRSRGAQVPLDFDPFASAENALVVWEGGSHYVQDLAESLNGTLLNFEPLPKGERRVLYTGDLLGVGRSLLMFRG